VRGARALLEWYEPRRRSFPWRGAAPYAVLVSEVMLQQTQATRVLRAYGQFLARFPTVDDLAAASPAAAIRTWDGLGYNRRAVALHRAARAIVERHGGRVPDSVEALRALPGVGPYTAAAVACFAHGVQLPVVETNVRRVLARAALGVEPREVPPRDLEAIAASSLPSGRAVDWNQALMDLGREVCRLRPRCPECALAPGCAYRRAGRTPAGAPNGGRVWGGSSPRGERVSTTSGERTPQGKRQPRFEGSSRPARGRIVALLRDRGTLSLQGAAGEAGLTTARAAVVVAGLARDGLVRAGPGAMRGHPRGRIGFPR